MRPREIVTSPKNPLLKEIRRALERGTLTRDGLCVAETFHLVEEASAAGLQFAAVIATESAAARLSPRLDARLIVVPEAIFHSLASTEAAQGVLALVRPPAWSEADLWRGCPLLVVLDGLQDPGNAGTIVRAAEAFGASGVVFLKGSVSAWNSKLLRASAGSLFRVPFVEGVDAGQVCAWAAAHGVELHLALPRGGSAAQSTDLRRPLALAIGSEGHGVGMALRAAGKGLSIATTGVESLNAAVAAAILLYEVARQRATP